MSDKCEGGTVSKPCGNGSAVRLNPENGVPELLCWRHLLPHLRTFARGGKTVRFTLKEV